jgi:geranylgeranyl pyrophosphate synthase
VTAPPSIGLDVLKPEMAALERVLRATSDRLPGPYGSLLDLMFRSGGKRIRPSLVFATARMGAVDAERARNLAAAVETVHAATLVHDDIVDQSTMRRGSPTLNQRWGAGATVLAGDWLFARSAQFAAATGSLRVIEVFARTLQTLTDGELRQLHGRHRRPTRAEYEDRIYAKTASLFEASTEMAALLAGLTEHQIVKMATFGRELGLAFQIVDDLLDFTGSRDRLGKPVGSDLRAGTLTLPAILHLERAGAPAEAAPLDDLDGLAQRVAADAPALAAAAEAADAHMAAALAALDGAPAGEGKELLTAIARRAVERDY